MLIHWTFCLAGEALYPPDGGEERAVRCQRQLLADQQACECAVGVEQGAQLADMPTRTHPAEATCGALLFAPYVQPTQQDQGRAQLPCR